MVRVKKIGVKFQRRKKDYVKVPALTIEGKWFEKAGFESKDIVSIRIENNRIIIEKAVFKLKAE